MRQEIEGNMDIVQQKMVQQIEAEQVAQLSSQELKGALDKIAYLESVLAQREEELAQAYATLEGQKEVSNKLRHTLNERAVTLEEAADKLAESESWVFQLAAERKHLESKIDSLNNKLVDAEKRVRDICRERDRLIDQRSELAELLSREAARAQDIAEQLDVERMQAISDLEKLSQEKMATEADLADRFNELAAMARLLAEKESMAQFSEERVEWLRQMSIVFMKGAVKGRKRYMSLTPAAIRYSRDMLELKKAGVFDSAAYLQAHPDVAASGQDPLLHYLMHGISEGRYLGF